jgi:hypothetical protein
MYGCLESDIDILYTKNKTKYGLITVILNQIIKSNFFEKSIANKTKVQVVILKQSFLSKEYTSLLKKDATVLLKGELIKTPTFEKPKQEFSSEDIKALNTDCLMLIGETSNVSVLSVPKGKELENLEFYIANAVNFNHMLSKTSTSTDTI